MTKKEKIKEATLVGRIKKMIEAGYSDDEIIETLDISIVTFNTYKKMIEE